jgi:hypothetical protein
MAAHRTGQVYRCRTTGNAYAHTGEAVVRLPLAADGSFGDLKCGLPVDDWTEKPDLAGYEMLVQALLLELQGDTAAALTARMSARQLLAEAKGLEPAERFFEGGMPAVDRALAQPFEL